MTEATENTKRIAKNTIVLYIRMLFLMAVGLYTSRIILKMLGVEDFGIYNVVGGLVALFGIISKSLTTAASRFLNYEMGRDNQGNLQKVFSVLLTIHFFLAIIIFLLAELIGVWFVNNKLVIPPDRLFAANWVFQISLLTFCLNLTTVPYHAAIIAHERMNFFAYVSIFEGIAKLVICYFLLISPIDRLIFYAFLHFLVVFVVCLLNKWYCNKFFPESIYSFYYDKSLLKEIFGFSGWNFIGTSSVLLRNQGGNILINLFGGPVVNAARAIANQVLHAVNGFVENFVIALNPQITKSYASGDWKYMMFLIFAGSRISYYMLLVLCLPVLIKTDYLLQLWLENVPEKATIFVRLTLLFTMIESISRPLITAQLATGKIRNYQIVVGGFQILNLPVSYVFLKVGYEPEIIMYVAVCISVCCLIARLYMLKNMIPIKVVEFLSKVIINIILVTITASFIPLLINTLCNNTLIVFLAFCMLTIICTIISIILVGCNQKERSFVYLKVKSKTSFLRNKVKYLR